MISMILMRHLYIAFVGIDVDYSYTLPLHTFSETITVRLIYIRFLRLSLICQ